MVTVTVTSLPETRSLSTVTQAAGPRFDRDRDTGAALRCRHRDAAQSRRCLLRRTAGPGPIWLLLSEPDSPSLAQAQSSMIHRTRTVSTGCWQARARARTPADGHSVTVTLAHGHGP